MNRELILGPEAEAEIAEAGTGMISEVPGSVLCSCRRRDARGSPAKPFPISDHLGTISARGASPIPLQFDLYGVGPADYRCILLPRPTESESLQERT